ncbi:MAG: histidine phosphatase family protein [Lachnospiraceae bacterium]|nr:histidine phosphatase family protein [Lachnospiraceae bacterium]
MKVYFIRHGETEYNKERRYQGNRDIPLSEEGKKKLRQADFSPAIVYVSALRRTSETASILFPEAVLRIDPGLNEMRFGAFEGRTADEMADDPAYRDWVAHDCETRCPGGEDKETFRKRVCAAVERVIAESIREDRQETVILAHGGVIMASLEVFGNPRRVFYDWLPGNGGGYVFEYDPGKPLNTLQLSRELSYASDFVKMKIQFR